MSNMPIFRVESVKIYTVAPVTNMRYAWNVKTCLIRGKSSKFPLSGFMQIKLTLLSLLWGKCSKLFEYTHKHECFIPILLKYILIDKKYRSWSKASETIAELLAYPRQDDKILTLEEVVTSGGLVDRLKYIESRVDRLELSQAKSIIWWTSFTMLINKLIP